MKEKFFVKNSLEFFSIWLLLALSTVTVVFNSCSKDDDSKQDALTFDEGVIINGVKWATRNVAAPGTFTAKPKDAGMFYQWNRKKAWAATGDITDWDATDLEGTEWTKSNDPSPSGWRVPTFDEIKTLLDTDKVSNEWTTQNGINGKKYTDKTSGNFIFLPAVGYRYTSVGMLDGVGLYGDYWSSTARDSDNAYSLGFGIHDDVVLDNVICVNWNYRYYGQSVRAVAE